MYGFLNLNKTLGLTSHDCVAKVRRSLNMRQIGHGGTLDPSATGVLPIAIGKATRLLQYLPQGKTYHATVRFGVQTTTDDLEGEVVRSQPVPHLTLENITNILPQFSGTIQQIPPSYSAIQVKGQRLYNLARAGKPVAAPVRTVVVDRIDVLNWRPGAFPELDLAIACGTGTYIRAIARDLGDRLGTGGTLAALCRTESCGFHLENSLTLETLTEQVATQTFQPIAPEVGLVHLPSIELDAEKARRWCQGQRITQTEPALPSDLGIMRVHTKQQQFLGIGQLIQSQNEILLVPRLVFMTDMA
jgi:tRNA pseudouridine55 synthase